MLNDLARAMKALDGKKTHPNLNSRPTQCRWARLHKRTAITGGEMGGRRIWPFHVSEYFQEHLWIWVSPRRFAIISSHPTNEKLNHFYSNKMHEHHILALRTSVTKERWLVKIWHLWWDESIWYFLHWKKWICLSSWAHHLNRDGWHCICTFHVLHVLLEMTKPNNDILFVFF